MKNTILFAMIALSLNAFAAPAKSKAKPVTFAEFAKDATQQNLDADCQFSAAKVKGGLHLELTSEKNHKLELFVPSNASIRMSQQENGEIRTYEINGLGTLVITNADDAFDRVDLATAEGTESCEIDM